MTLLPGMEVARLSVLAGSSTFHPTKAICSLPEPLMCQHLSPAMSECHQSSCWALITCVPQHHKAKLMSTFQVILLVCFFQSALNCILPVLYLVDVPYRYIFLSFLLMFLVDTMECFPNHKSVIQQSLFVPHGTFLSDAPLFCI